VATGRAPDLDDLNLIAAGVSSDQHGVPKFESSTLQCGDTSVFVAGDVDGQRPVLHEASFEGTIAGKNAAAFPYVQESERAVPLSIMFTDPPVAVIGQPKSENSVAGTTSYAEQGRAKVEARNAGLIRIYADRSDGALVGAVLFGPAMDHIAHLFAWAIGHGATASQMLDLPFYHPTFEEGLKPALRQICEAAKEPELRRFDDVGPPGA
jgi:dihydrolipoyl dehydrogenase